jgi:hypothetical protein
MNPVDGMGLRCDEKETLIWTEVPTPWERDILAERITKGSPQHNGQRHDCLRP